MLIGGFRFMKSLFETTEISGMELKNRFICSAIWEGLADDEGHVTQELIQHYHKLAEGGVGTIITGFSNVMDFDKPTHNMNGIYNDDFVQEYEELIEKVHEHRVNIIMQVVHGGTKWGPSAVKHKATGTVPKEMTTDEIDTVTQAFGEAALRVKNAGFDGVQIHAAHGFLLSMFLNPYYNVRTDEYGGSIDNRARIVYETYSSVRDAVGPDFPVFIKVNCKDFMDEGLTFEDSLHVCKKLADMGINMIEVSGGSYSSRDGEGPMRNTENNESYFMNYASKIATEVDVPVALVGGNRRIEKMTEILNTTQIDYFSMARPFIQEPGLINKWMEHDLDSSECVSCHACNGISGGCVFK
jgi:2,4-dienoyl-CoA reductase-like NADH-dependent reductase (Old Yellow Enzyme family)